ncbi:hypothetical protein AARAC_010414, partial [Aspergillus arachidicola]
WKLWAKEDDHYLQQFTANPDGGFSIVNYSCLKGRSQPKFVATNNEYCQPAWTKKLTLL